MQTGFYEIPHNESVLNRVLLEKREAYSLYEVTFPSPVQTESKENNTVYSLHYRPNHHRKGFAIVVFHGWLARRAPFERRISQELAAGGFDAFLLNLPYHLKRTPKGRRSGKDFFSKDLKKTYSAFHQAVLDARKLADLLQKDGYRIGGFGLSLGAILLNLLMGVDERYEIGVSVVGGGDFNTLLRKGWMGRWVVKSPELNGRKWEDRKICMEYRKFLSEIDETGKIPKPPREWFLLDPLTYAHRNHPRRVLLFNGLFDPIIPRASVLKLTNRLGISKPVWLPTEHFSILLFMPYMMKKSLAFFERFSNSH
ncbi:hypothetical protein IIA15_11865 [candidate division TA06 bacterium]|nr:hypothetical protein [candidate division TA06 bacterium]